MNRVVFAFGTLFIGWLLLPATALAQIHEVKIAVDGLACSLCAANLERSLGRLDDVSRVEASVANKAAIVHLKSGSSFDPEKFRTAVRNAGQQARAFELQLSAVVRAEGGGYRLQPGRGMSLAVRGGSADKLKPLIGKPVFARAKVVSSPRSPVELELIDVVTW
jgi:copper chaperone CopZ